MHYNHTKKKKKSLPNQSPFRTEMEGAILITLSDCICCLFWGLSREMVLMAAQTLLQEVARSGAARGPAACCWIGFA